MPQTPEPLLLSLWAVQIEVALCSFGPVKESLACIFPGTFNQALKLKPQEHYCPRAREFRTAPYGAKSALNPSNPQQTNPTCARDPEPRSPDGLQQKFLVSKSLAPNPKLITP